MSALLEARILGPLRPRVGDRLEAVHYCCLRHEATPADISDPHFYLGGEVRLRFSGGDLFITWDENAGWESDFSLQARSASAFDSDTLETFDAGSVPYWRSLIGQPLATAVVFGWDATPFGIHFIFPTGSVIVGSAVETRIGDGDDVAIHGPDYLDNVAATDTLWSSDRPSLVFAKEAPAEPLDERHTQADRGIHPERGEHLPLLLFALGILALSVAPYLDPWVGIVVAVTVILLAGARYRIGEGFVIHLLRLLLLLGALVVVVVIIRARWFG